MKLKFNPDLDYQEQAIASIIDLFKGQEDFNSVFTVASAGTVDELGQIRMQDDTGYRNRLSLTDEELLRNAIDVQRRHTLPISEPDDIKMNSRRPEQREFCIDMETGTGKTYVYLRSIMELHARHKFSKFIIVVPGKAIREGVKKSLDIMHYHLEQLYNASYHHFVYDSRSLTDVRQFARSPKLEIMVINIQAFQKDDNIINQQRDGMEGSALNLIKETRPIVIVDEPQSASNTPAQQAAVLNLDPLAVFNYSATHTRTPNLMYQLSAVDAYNRKLVKQIEVASVRAENFFNAPYVRYIKPVVSKTRVRAQLELHDMNGRSIKPKKIIVQPMDDLYSLTNNAVYDGFIIKSDGIGGKNNPFVEFANRQVVTPEKEISANPQQEIRRTQIRQTIEEHLRRERKLNIKGIKVLTLFFIDKVENYRVYNDDGSWKNGAYAKAFQEEYSAAIRSPRFKDLFEDNILDREVPVEDIHNGYFAQDKNGKWKDTADTDRSRESKDAAAIYDLIMKDKERLLSFDEPLRFIFSHSALKEGWDNPNVFQICTLKEVGGSERRRRQEIGRGLRLAVNQEGERVHGHEINTLTVMASESYQEFVDGLQNEMEKATGRKFGVLDKAIFARVAFIENGETVNLTRQQSSAIWSHLRENEHITAAGKAKDSLKRILKEDRLPGMPYNIPENAKSGIKKVLVEMLGSLEIKDVEQRKTVKVRKEVLLDPRFVELWDRIKQKTRYNVNFDSDELIQKCAESIKLNLRVSGGKLVYSKVGLEMDKGAMKVGEELPESIYVGGTASSIPDIMGYLQNEIGLTRRSLMRIISDSGRIDLIKRNPQFFIRNAAEIIRDVMATTIVDGIKYEKMGEEAIWAMELFSETDLYQNQIIASTKSPMEYISYDSGIESKLVKEFENSRNVEFYAKLPYQFKIATPLGPYNPDWAVLWRENDEKKLYFVAESKGTQLESQLRGVEKAKIQCARKHFKMLDTGVQFEKITQLEDLSIAVAQ